MDSRQFKEEYEKIILTADDQGAFKLLSLIKEGKILGTDKINHEIIVLRWLAIDRIVDEEVKNLFQEHLWEAFDIDFELLRQLKSRFLFIPQKQRDNYKNELLESLRKNNQLISEQAYINNQGQKLINTIGTWLKEYFSLAGAEPLTTIQILNFYRENKNFNNLTSEQQVKLRKLINLVEWLKHSTFSLKGSPEDFSFLFEGKYYGVIDGQIYGAGEKIKTPLAEGLTIEESTTISKTTPLSASQFKDFQDNYEKLLSQLIDKEQLRNIREKLPNAPAIIINNFKNQVALKDLNGIIASLEKLISLNGLEALIKNFKESFAAYLESRFGQGSGKIINQLTPEVLGLFLQFLFINQLKISQESGAVLSLYLANVLAKTGEKQFLPMVYGDVKSGTFKWREIVLENGQLKFK